MEVNYFEILLLIDVKFYLLHAKKLIFNVLKKEKKRIKSGPAIKGLTISTRC